MSLIKIILVMPATNASSECTPMHWEGWSLISVQPCRKPPQSSYAMHSSYGASDGTKPQACHQWLCGWSREEALIHLYAMHSSYGASDETKPQACHQWLCGWSREEALIHLWPLFHIAVIDVDECLWLSLYIYCLVLVISAQNCSILSVELWLY